MPLLNDEKWWLNYSVDLLIFDNVETFVLPIHKNSFMFTAVSCMARSDENMKCSGSEHLGHKIRSVSWYDLIIL